MRSLAEAREVSSRSAFSVILLDRFLPDCQTDDHVRVAIAAWSGTPVVVLTGLDDEEWGMNALGWGAQDFLLKDQLGPNDLERSLLYAIERKRLTDTLEGQRQSVARDHEQQAYERLGGESVAASLLGVGALSESIPERYGELVEAYAVVLDQSIEASVFRTAGRASRDLRELGQHLGFLRATPRDLMQLHSRAIELRVAGKDPGTIEKYAAEGRFLVIELMGELVYYYRTYYVQWGAESKHDVVR